MMLSDGLLLTAAEIDRMDTVPDLFFLSCCHLGKVTSSEPGSNRLAMGITVTEVTKQAGKMILADENFATIVLGVREGRGILGNIHKFLRY